MDIKRYISEQCLGYSRDRLRSFWKCDVVLADNTATTVYQTVLEENGSLVDTYTDPPKVDIRI